MTPELRKMTMEEAWWLAVDAGRKGYWAISVACDGPGYVARATKHGANHAEPLVIQEWSVDWDEEWQYGEKGIVASPTLALIKLAKALEGMA